MIEPQYDMQDKVTADMARRIFELETKLMAYQNMHLEPWQKEKELFTWSNWEKCSFSNLAACVGPGWTKLLDETCAKLFALGWTGCVDQVKEKYGTLRFYFRNDCKYPDIAYDVVDMAEYRSGQICEECGEYGELRGEGWFYTACEACHRKRQGHEDDNHESYEQ